MEKKCKFCQRCFSPTRKNNLYCMPICKSRARHVIENREAKKRPDRIFNCKKCNQKVKVSGASNFRNFPRKFCSKRCRDAYKGDRHIKNRPLDVIKWRRDKKKKLVELLGGCCCICKFDRSLFALDFHHKDPATKDFNIAGKSFAFEILKKEALKCVLLCANCHRMIHSGELSLREYI